MVKRLTLCIFLSVITFSTALGQNVLTQRLTGVVVDALTGDSIEMAGVAYRSKRIMTAADRHGRFTIERYPGQTLHFSAVGYKTVTIPVTNSTPQHLVIKLKTDAKQLGEVLVKSKKGRYSRKENPAVMLMRRVIAAKQRTHLDNNPYYQFNKYQKLTLARNNVMPESLAELKQKGKSTWMTEQCELCPMNGKIILPLQVSETVTQKVYCREPRDEKTTVLGEQTSGVATLIESAGEALDAIVKDIFLDVDIYDDQIRLLRHPFTSPIGKDAIRFYRFYITDTCYVGKDQCISLSFVPNNQQDFGFRGDLWVLNDSTLHVRKVSLTIPKKSDVNFVENMKVEQEYIRLPDGQWVLDTDNMMAELRFNQMLNNAIVLRTTKYSQYSFDKIPKSAFRGTATYYVDPESRQRGKAFWNEFRTVSLTKSEASMGKFVDNITRIKGMKYLLFVGKAFINNYIGTTLKDSVDSKFEFGPVNTIINKNIVDGYRFRLSGRTTAALNPHLFWEGYVARGMDSKETYYSTLFTYAFNRKQNSPWEFPVRELSFLSEYDIMSPSDKFLHTNKDNLFTSILRIKKLDKLYFYNRQKLQFKYETLAGFATTISLKTEGVKGAAAMAFHRMDGTEYIGYLRTTEAHVDFRFAPGETYFTTKQRRYPINHNAPVFTVGHTVSMDGVLGSKYRMNYTEASIYKRFWLNSWGRLDTHFSAGAQWDCVPFPLLIMPRTNLSYLTQRNTYTFQLMNNMEFLNDRFAMWHMSWDLNGKLFNRVPLLKHLKWREFIGFRGMYGKLTDKNNPLLPQNADSNVLMRFPEGCNVMTSKPYMELVFGVHNIFKFLEIDYVHRMTYRNLDTALSDGIRIGIDLKF